MTNYPCSVCEKEVLETDKGTSYVHCKKWVHYKWNELSDFDFKYLEHNKAIWYCIKCIPQIFSFYTDEINQANNNSKYLSKPKTALLNLINQFNNYSNEHNHNILDCNYRNVEYFKKLYNPFKNFVSFHIFLNNFTYQISSSSTLIDNIFCNLNHSTKPISGNLTSTISDHLPQIRILPEFFSNAPPSKCNIYTRNWKKFDE